MNGSVVRRDSTNESKYCSSGRHRPSAVLGGIAPSARRSKVAYGVRATDVQWFDMVPRCCGFAADPATAVPVQPFSVELFGGEGYCGDTFFQGSTYRILMFLVCGAGRGLAIVAMPGAQFFSVGGAVGGVRFAFSVRVLCDPFGGLIPQFFAMLLVIPLFIDSSFFAVFRFSSVCRVISEFLAMVGGTPFGGGGKYGLTVVGVALCGIASATDHACIKSAIWHGFVSMKALEQLESFATVALLLLCGGCFHLPSISKRFR
jgi:hypothetical protein